MVKEKTVCRRSSALPHCCVPGTKYWDVPRRWQNLEMLLKWWESGKNKYELNRSVSIYLAVDTSEHKYVMSN